jgi:hypothetical protein
MTNQNDQQLLPAPEALAFSKIAESIKLGTDGKITLKEFLHKKGLAIKEIALDSSGNVRRIELDNKTSALKLLCRLSYKVRA